MEIFFYHHDETEVSHKLNNAVIAGVPGAKISEFTTKELLSAGIRRCPQTISAAVLLASGSKDLLDLISINYLLGDIPKILILPDRHESTVKTGHHLLPRYISYTDSDFTDVASVLNKMFNQPNN